MPAVRSTLTASSPNTHLPNAWRCRCISHNGWHLLNTDRKSNLCTTLTTQKTTENTSGLYTQVMGRKKKRLTMTILIASTVPTAQFLRIVATVGVGKCTQYFCIFRIGYTIHSSIPVRSKSCFSVLQCRNRFRAHPAFYSTRTEGKVATAWRWPLTAIKCRVLQLGRDALLR